MVADEIIGAVSSKLIPVSRVIRLINKKPETLDLVLTGRHLPDRILKKADLVTQMQSLKHPFGKGVLAKKGVDY